MRHAVPRGKILESVYLQPMRPSGSKTGPMREADENFCLERQYGCTQGKQGTPDVRFSFRMHITFVRGIQEVDS